jgi:hypothetical protein
MREISQDRAAQEAFTVSDDSEADLDAEEVGEGQGECRRRRSGCLTSLLLPSLT